MYSFKGILNPDNILDTSKLDYEYDCTSQQKICQICGLIINTGYSCYNNKEDNYHICDSCYTNLRCPAICRTCMEEFDSKNELFRHLEEIETHNIDPLVYKTPTGDELRFICKRDYDIFASPPGTFSECDDYNNIDYQSIMNSTFYKRKGFQVKFCIISQHSSTVIPKVDNITSQNYQDYTNICFNGGSYNILYDHSKSIGWIQFRNDFVVPISSIILII